MEFTFVDGPGSPAKQDKAQWLIDKGAFFDRFGSVKMPILLSQDSTIKALLTDISNRNWIDLQNPEVASMLTYIGTVIPELTLDLQNTILTKSVDYLENLALRKLYFS